MSFSANSLEIAYLDIGCTNVNEDFRSCLVYDKHGNQDVLKTINNYIELLNKTVGVLSILKDSISQEEAKEISLFTEGDDLGINGSSHLIDRFVGFGLASTCVPEEWTDNESDESYDESDSD